MIWEGVWPAVTTPFDPSIQLDRSFLQRHIRWLRDAGCPGVVVLGSLGEAAALDPAERLEVIDAAVEASEGQVLVGVGATSTHDAVRLAREAERRGASGLMVLPPYVYRGDWRETQTHFAEVLGSTQLPCLLYNNPVAYGTDLRPHEVEELVLQHPRLVAVKESSGEVRRFKDLHHRLGNRVALFVGIDDQVLDAVAAGAQGWIAGLANAFPSESVALLRDARMGETAKALELYRWFLPLLKMDAEPKFVQLIKLVQQEVGQGSARVRAPRLELSGDELAAAQTTIRKALAARPQTEGPRQ